MTGAIIAAIALGGAPTPGGGGGGVPNYPDGTVLFKSQTAGAWQYKIQAGVAFVDIEGWAAGGPGGETFFSTPFGGGTIPGFGGGGGGYFKTHTATTSGTVYSGLLGAAGNAGSVTNGGNTTLNAVAGGPSSATANGGTAAQSGATAGVGGSASGGSVTNVSGHSGTFLVGGGAGPSPVDGASPPQNPGGGGNGSVPPANGAAGQIVITARSS